ncbi:FecR family protein [Snuella sedimenti]|uniref:DUF4974 domain-containing protein n=1 Tax=Snuella sedimenti TaxID=2798802 RepID=A0A8J7IG16_9FLAO|nr:FecR domain-containing protein [Snuella sedimenti]MBJ6368627.1 DUF4974 domain-containing protein [Snuella sedimenti]
MHIDVIKVLLESYNNTKKINRELFQSLSVEEQSLINALVQEHLVKDALDCLNSIDKEEEWDKFRSKIILKKKNRDIIKVSLKYAVVFVGLFLSVYFLSDNFSNEIQEEPHIQEIVFEPVDNNSVKLISSQGVSVIDQEENKEFISSQGSVLSVQEKNKLSYNVNSEINGLVYNELYVPFGNKIFNLELSDGTLIYLNAGTRLKYPVRFLSGHKREVQILEGEAFFKVAKDKEHPFVVSSNNMEVQVLGTEFNMSSYPEDDEEHTVLVEGKVQLSYKNTESKSFTLTPGYKGSWNKQEGLATKSSVDVDIYTSWIKGDLIFRDTPFINMVKKLERRYNVSIEVNNELLKDKRFNASFNVELESIEVILSAISKIYPFSLEKVDNKIVIN